MGKQKAKDDGKKEELDPRLIEIWKRANADLEPSTKLLALLRLLKSWDATGDKTICFSQCQSESLSRCEIANIDLIQGLRFWISWKPCSRDMESRTYGMMERWIRGPGRLPWRHSKSLVVRRSCY